VAEVPFELKRLLRSLGAVCFSPFDDRDVRLLLVELRPYMSDLRVRQLAHYIAHPEGIRMGELYDTLEHLWFTYKTVRWRDPKNNTLAEKLRRLPKPDFNYLLVALTRVTDAEWSRWIRDATREEAAEIWKANYVEGHDHYRLKNPKRLPIVQAIFESAHCKLAVPPAVGPRDIASSFASAIV
jgi:hypothetical protein